MPKGTREPRECTCRGCGATFVSARCGRAAWYCAPDCSGRRPRKRTPPPPLTEEEKRQRALKRAAETRRRRQLARMRAKGLEAFAPILEDPEQMVLAQDALEIVALASSLPPLEARSLRQAAVRLRNARGRHETHAAAQHLAAIGLKLADTFRPREAGVVR